MCRKLIWLKCCNKDSVVQVECKNPRKGERCKSILNENDARIQELCEACHRFQVANASAQFKADKAIFEQKKKFLAEHDPHKLDKKSVKDKILGREKRAPAPLTDDRRDLLRLATHPGKSAIGGSQSSRHSGSRTPVSTHSSRFEEDRVFVVREQYPGSGHKSPAGGSGHFARDFSPRGDADKRAKDHRKSRHHKHSDHESSHHSHSSSHQSHRPSHR